MESAGTSYPRDKFSSGYKTAFSLYQEDIQNGTILSYNEKLDEILKNVMVTKSVVELTGHSGSGKTQLCFQLCISVQLPKFIGGVGGQSLYISTNFNFSVERLGEMARNFAHLYDNIKGDNSFQFNEKIILRNIHFVKIDSAIELIGCLAQLGNFLSHKNIKLVVIDSISNPLRKLEATNRLNIISKIFMELKSLADKHDFAIVITNDMTTRVNGDIALTVPSFGDSFYHLVNSRIILSKSHTYFHAHLIKSSLMGPKEVYFQL
ncbi:unnamed protein product [Phaedon cochleariae]|uniref:DNA repair protein RAD51 homolog 3 n=1 Tax=Phaedon cochleariae TaxID=80249 RepID=A0A9N9SIK3_PHACE|nr:unnamed protein product [Phaedon cochleariae]